MTEAATIDAIHSLADGEKVWCVWRGGEVIGRVVDRTPYVRHEHPSEPGGFCQIGTAPHLGSFEAQYPRGDGGWDGGPEFYTRAEAFAWVKE